MSGRPKLENRFADYGFTKNIARWYRRRELEGLTPTDDALRCMANDLKRDLRREGGFRPTKPKVSLEQRQAEMRARQPQGCLADAGAEKYGDSRISRRTRRTAGWNPPA